MAMMWAKGMSYREIAAATGYSYAQVSAVMRRDFMQEICAKVIEAGGLDSVAHTLKAAESDSLMLLIELRDTTKNEKLKAHICDSILDRSRGKATAHVITERATAPADPKAAAQTLFDEIRALQEGLKGPVTGGSN